MDDKHDPNGSVPIGTFKATSEDGELEIPIEIAADDLIEDQQLAADADREREREREIEVDFEQTTPQGGPLFHDHEPPRRQRVATLIGVQLPGAAAASAARFAGAEPDPTKASRREIAAAVDEALDERPTTIYGYNRNSLAELEQLVEAEMTEIPSSADHTGEIVGVVGRSSDTGTFQIEVHEVPDSRKSPLPVLAPAQFVEARAREQRDQVAVESTRSLLSTDRARDGQPTAAIASRTDRDRVQTRPTQTVQAKPAPSVQKPISSLAPMEVDRGRAAVAKRREPTSAIGYALVAAMVLLGVGGWFLTSGGYRRSTDAASQPTAAASVVRPADPQGSPKLATTPTTPTPAPVENPVPTVPAVVNTPEPADAKASAPSDIGSARPRVASKTVKKAGAAPTPAPALGQIEAPSRDDVLNGLDRVRSTVRACAEGHSGVAEVDLTIAANGVVTNALVGGDFGGTPQGSCIARAVRKAKFPTFKQDRYRVLFPYVL